MTANGVTYHYSSDKPPFSTADVNQIHVSSSCKGLSSAACLDATAIYLGNNVVMGWAATYTVASANSLAVTWGYTGPPTFPGATAIAQGFDGKVLESINATGTLSINGAQATVSAKGSTLAPQPNVSPSVSPNVLQSTTWGVPQWVLIAATALGVYLFFVAGSSWSNSSDDSSRKPLQPSAPDYFDQRTPTGRLADQWARGVQDTFEQNEREEQAERERRLRGE